MSGTCLTQMSPKVPTPYTPQTCFKKTVYRQTDRQTKLTNLVWYIYPLGTLGLFLHFFVLHFIYMG